MLTRTWIQRTVWMALLIMGVFVTAEVEAQLRGGGFFRNGAASSGGWQANRSQRPGNWHSSAQQLQSRQQTGAAANQASRQNTAQQMQTRQQTGDATSQASRQNTAKDLQTRHQAGDAANRKDWQSHANQGREDRQGYRTESREDWQDYGEPRREYWENGGGYYGASPAYPAGGVVTEMAIGSSVTAAAFNAQKASCRTLVVNGTSYYQCGSTWYQPSAQGGNVTYIVVSAPK